MAYIPMTAKANGDPVSANDWNKVVNNFAAGIPGAYTAKGDMLAGTGIDAGSRLAVGANGAYLFADASQTPGMVWSIPGRAAVVGAGGQLALEYSTWTKINWLDTETFDTAAAFANDRFTCPHAGYYWINGRMRVQTAAGVSSWTHLHLALYKNGAAYCYLNTLYLQAVPASTYLTISGSTAMKLAKGDYLELYYYSDHASNMIIYRYTNNDLLQVMPLL